MASKFRPIAHLGPYVIVQSIRVIIIDKNRDERPTDRYRQFLVGDESGTVILTLVNFEHIDLLKKGDILEIENAKTNLYMSHLTIMADVEFCTITRTDTMKLLYKDDFNISRYEWRSSGGSGRDTNYYRVNDETPIEEGGHWWTFPAKFKHNSN